MYLPGIEVSNDLVSLCGDGPPENLLMRSYYSTLPSKINVWEGKLFIISGPSR